MANLFTIVALDVIKIDSLTTHAAKVSAKLFSELDFHFPPFFEEIQNAGLLLLLFFLLFAQLAFLFGFRGKFFGHRS